MVRLLTKFVGLMFLLVVIIASHSILFAESGADSTHDYSYITDINCDNEADDPESNLLSIQIAEVDNYSVDQNTIPKSTAYNLLSSLPAIRAPPILYI